MNVVMNRFRSLWHPRKKVAVVTPVYRLPLTEDERTAIRHLRHFLGHYDRFIVAPKGLEITAPDFNIIRFPAWYFKGIDGYNHLMLSKEFYRAFADYEYILIYQLDCLVFANDLDAWCAKGWDYVGAPWFRDEHDGAGRVMWQVGNGGLSLRHVRRHLEVLNSRRLWYDPLEAAWQTPCRATVPLLQRVERRLNQIRYRLGFDNDVNACIRHSLGPQFNEDAFWVECAAQFCPAFRIPTPREALPFSFEVEPHFCYRENGNRLPFGCHAWAKIDRAFWEPFLLPEGGDGGIRLKTEG